MVILENPNCLLAGMQNTEFKSAVKLICRCDKLFPVEMETFIQNAEDYEQFTVRNLVNLSKRKRVDLFFEDLYIASWRFDEYEKIKKGGITLTDIESNETFRILKAGKGAVIDEFLTRSFDYAYSQAKKFKTADGRRNFMRRYFKSLREHSGQMCSDNILRIEALEMIVEANGVEPSARNSKRRKK